MPSELDAVTVGLYHDTGASNYEHSKPRRAGAFTGEADQGMLDGYC